MCFCAIGCQYSTINRLFGCVFLVWRHHLRRVNKSSVCSFRRFSTVFLLFDVPEYSNTFDYVKDKRPAVYFINQKKSLHIIFKPYSINHFINFLFQEVKLALFSVSFGVILCRLNTEVSSVVRILFTTLALCVLFSVCSSRLCAVLKDTMCQIFSPCCTPRTQRLGKIRTGSPSNEMLNTGGIMKFLWCSTKILLYHENRIRWEIVAIKH